MPHLGDPVRLRALVAVARRPRRTPPARRTTPARHVTIVSAGVGAGHDGAAAELARRLTAAGLAVDRIDLLDVLPAGLGRIVRDGYHRMLVRAPWAYQLIYDSTERAGGGGPMAKALLRSTEHRLLSTLHPGTGAVVSTYPGASRVLGALRLDGRLDVPVLTYLTDFSVHPLWVAPGVDVHLAAHAVPAAQARAAGARDVRVSGPVADPRFRPCDASGRGAARARFGLPEDAPLALLVAGSWGVGPVRQVARELRDRGGVVPVVVCGRNDTLADRLRADGVEHVHGWVDDMPGLMHASDVLVQNAGGLTSLEAFATGLPVASYRCIPGHGLTNAAALHEAGLAAWIRDPGELAYVLDELIDGPRGLLQREAGLALFANEIAAAAGTVNDTAGADGTVIADGTVLADGTVIADGTVSAGGTVAVGGIVAADRGPAAETARVCRAGVAGTPSPPRRRNRRPAVLRLATTAAMAGAVWAGAVGTAVATTDGAPSLMHAIGHGLDFDDLGGHGGGGDGHCAQGHHS